MKKSILFAMAAMSLAFVSCTGTKSTNAATSSSDSIKAATTTATKGTTVEKTTTTSTDTPKADTATDAVQASLDSYETYVNTAIPLLEKMEKGDATATSDFTKLAGENQKVATDAAQNYVTKFNADQKAKYEELNKKYKAAALAAVPKSTKDATDKATNAAKGMAGIK